jgi:hypothetical protein
VRSRATLTWFRPNEPPEPSLTTTFPTNRGICFASVGATSDSVFRLTFILQHHIATTEDAYSPWWPVTESSSRFVGKQEVIRAANW